MPNITYPDARRHETANPRSAMGQSTIDIRCPFCGQWVTAYIWSLAGSGKLCPCGAKHGSWGLTLPPKRKNS